MIPDTSILNPADDFRRCIDNIWSPYEVNGEVKKNTKLNTSRHCLNVTIVSSAERSVNGKNVLRHDKEIFFFLPRSRRALENQEGGVSQSIGRGNIFSYWKEKGVNTPAIYKNGK
jgi:hypothetical protein